MKGLIMTDKEIAENNILLASFRGGTLSEDKQDIYFPKGIQHFSNIPIPNLAYHKSLDWLDTVLQQIEQLNYHTAVLKGIVVDTNDYVCYIGHYFDQALPDWSILIESRASTKIEAIYNAVVEFVNVRNPLATEGSYYE